MKSFQSRLLSTIRYSTLSVLALSVLLEIQIFQCKGSSDDGTDSTIGYDDLLTVSANLQSYYDNTQFYQSNHNAVVGQWDARIELWFPPYYYGYTNLCWGAYLRFAGIAASQNPAWENGLLAAPGGGLQIYPFSLAACHDNGNVLGELFGPLRLYGEYDYKYYWGRENSWRPTGNITYGLDYWRAAHVNNPNHWWWAEFWGGAWWQSSNEYNDHYDSWFLASSLRSGLRWPRIPVLSDWTPYVVIESSQSSHPGSYWENRLLVGGGLRFAPSLNQDSMLDHRIRGLNRIVFFVEYVNALAYYDTPAPSSVPKYDVQAGLSFSLGDWYWNH